MTDEQAKEPQGSQPSDSGRYDVNFFKPKSAHSKADTKMISTLVIIWAVAVFGFQLLLLATSKPTPEPAHVAFQQVWEKVENGTADAESQKQFSRSVLSVLGKNIAVSDADKTVLKEALSYSVNSLLPADQKEILNTYSAEDAQTKVIAGAIGLSDTGFDQLMTALLPSSLANINTTQLSDQSKAALPGIMELYLVHNRGFLTDMKFLRFPFHYWYTAQFLLILFVLLCLIYAVFIDKINTKYDFADK